MVRCALLPTHAEELAWLADSLAHLVRTGTRPGDIAVLCRTATDFADIQAALVQRDIPVEVVGLSGLLHLPEIADLVAVCEVLQDPTANASLVRLLTGPRWRIGPRDLALLGRRARTLVPYGGAGTDPERRLAEAVEGVDPTETISLADALDTFLTTAPDDLPFSSEAAVRFARLATELRDLRRSLADPLMDVLHRVLATTGLEVELSASPHALAARRRETLTQFLDIAASFAALDGETTLPAFLGFLRTAAQYEKGLDSSLPGGEDTVKILTAHKSKGLEWDVVAVPGLVAKTFPSEQSRDAWTAQPKVLPHALRGDADTLPDVHSWTSRGLAAFKTEMKEHQHTEELRLGYVTFTRPRSVLLGSGHWWGPQQKKPRGPSTFLEALRAHCEAGHGEIEAWAEAPEEGAENPALREEATDHSWPLPLDPDSLARRRAAAQAVLAHLDRLSTAPHPADSEPAHDPEWPPPPEDEEYDEHEPEDWDALLPTRPEAPEPPAVPQPRTDPAYTLLPEETRTVASWDRDLDALAGELRRARATVRDVELPRTLTASQLVDLAADPDAFARDLARPMPRRPQPAARRGTRFHAWVESRFEALPLPLLGPDELPGGAEDAPEIVDERDLAELKEAFQRTPYAHRTPHRVEAPFQLTLAGRTIRGRIDAVYRTPAPDGRMGGPTYEIVDWKTHRIHDADPLQLAIYRLAWAEQHGIPLSSVTAAFVYVRDGEVVRPPALPDRAELERILLGEEA